MTSAARPELDSATLFSASAAQPVAEYLLRTRDPQVEMWMLASGDLSGRAVETSRGLPLPNVTPIVEM